MNSPDALEIAVLRALLFADRFDYPLALDELHRALPGLEVPRQTLEAALGRAPLKELVGRAEGYFFMEGRRALAGVRALRREASKRFLAEAAPFVRALARSPFVEGIFLSGGNAFENPTDDDVDLFLAARRGGVWPALQAAKWTAAKMGLRKLMCCNYVVDASRLALPEESFFTAHQIIHLKALAGGDVLDRLWDANPWVRRFFPNARRPPAPPFTVPVEPRSPGRAWDTAAEILARTAFRAFLCRRPALRHGRAGVKLEPWRLKLHTLDHAPDQGPVSVQEAAALLRRAAPPCGVSGG